MENKNNKSIDLDAILDSALDEFDNIDSNINKSNNIALNNDIVNNETINSSNNKDDNISDDVDLHNMINKLEQILFSNDESNIDNENDEFLKNIAKQTNINTENSSIEDNDETNIIDGVISQLLGKNIMYEPTKLICDKFPLWLETNRSNLSEVDFIKYNNMYECFQKIVSLYETEPNDVKKLSDCIYELQQYGEPPIDIIKEITPDLPIGNPFTFDSTNNGDLNNGQCIIS